MCTSPLRHRLVRAACVPDMILGVPRRQLLIIALFIGTTGLIMWNPPAASARSRACGAKRLYGRTLRIRVVGQLIHCAQVRKIVRGQCRDRSVWSCFSFQAPDPLLVWFRSEQRFRKRWSTAIEARRYPCHDAVVTQTAWAAARRSSSRAFPTRLQVLSDDLLRCQQLKGVTHEQALALLGQPDDQSVERGNRTVRWDIGPERDSFFQIDNELLSLTFDPQNQLRSAKIVQG